MVDLDDYSVVTQPAAQYLSERQELDYRSEREDCLTWLLTFGKNTGQSRRLRERDR